MKIILGLILLTGCGTAECYREYRKVKKLGFCDKYGLCSVLLDDGTTAHMYEPIAGERVHIADICLDKKGDNTREVQR